MEENPYKPPRSPLSRGPAPGPVGVMCLTSIALSGLTSALLIYAGFHVDVDRTNRRPVVTWTGPAAAWGPHLDVIVFGLALTGFALALPAMGRDGGRVDPWGVLAFSLILLNVFGGCFFYAALFED